MISIDQYSIYPSVYVGFQTLFASDLCGLAGSPLTTATIFTLAYNQLSTANSYFWNWTQITGNRPDPVFTQINPASR